MPLPLAPTGPTTEDVQPIALHEAYRACEEIVRSHYENFPVASRFLPAERRIALAAIYAFARKADDIADAPAPTADRLAALDQIEGAFLEAMDGTPRGPILTAVTDAIERNRLPTEPFLDLLDAFREDARDSTYETWDDLLRYCRGSANTIGRLVLALYGLDEPEAQRESDALCTALQLTNFWQDLGADLERKRLFIPLEDLRHFGIGPGEIARPASRAALTRLMVHECRATDDLFQRGRGVARRAPFALALHLRATAAGGRAILRVVERSGWRVLRQRPSLGRWDRFRIGLLVLSGLDG